MRLKRRKKKTVLLGLKVCRFCCFVLIVLLLLLKKIFSTQPHNISDFGFAVSTKKDDEDDVDADVDQDGKIVILLFCLLT